MSVVSHTTGNIFEFRDGVPKASQDRQGQTVQPKTVNDMVM